MDLEKIITDLVEQSIDNKETFLVEISIKGNSNNQKIQVFIDGDHSVGVDECSVISRKLSDFLEEKNLIEGRYVIEVSSPGVSRPLKFIRQYHKHKGRDLEIVTKDKNKFKGELVDIIDEQIVISVLPGKSKKEESKTINVAFADIDTAKVLVRF